MSGALNITQDYPFYPTFDQAIGPVTLIPGTGPASMCKFGDPYTQQVFWEDNNPFYFASNLHGVDLWLSSGDGGDGVEDYIRRMNIWFIGALERAEIPYTNTFRPGTHSLTYWIDDLEDFIPWVTSRFAAPSATPTTFSYRGMSNDLGAWGWSFQASKQVKEFTYIDDVSIDGFTISGGGDVAVETASLYEPGTAYAIGAWSGPSRSWPVTTDSCASMSASARRIPFSNTGSAAIAGTTSTTRSARPGHRSSRRSATTPSCGRTG